MHNLEKKQAAKKALNFIKNNMILGLGSGSTMKEFVKLLSKENLNVKCLTTSKQIEKEAKKAKLKLIKSSKKIDLAIDGADQIDSKNNLLKGQGALAFVEEKKLDYKAKKCIIIADKSKLSKSLNKLVLIKIKNKNINLKNLNCKIIKKKNNILFLKFKQIKNPKKLEKDINKLPNIIDNGIFANFKKPIKIIVGYKRGAKVL